MKKLLYFSLLFSFSFLLTTSPLSAQTIKIAAVDMGKVFTEYYKTKKAEAELKDRANGMEKEVRDQEASFKKLSEDLKKLKDDAENPAYTDDKKTQNRRLLESKVSEAKIKYQQLNDMVASRRKELDEQRNRIRSTLVEEITKVIQEKAKKDGYSLIIDKTGQTLNQMSPFIYVQDAMDITPEIIKVLNAGAPAGSAKDSKK